MEKLLPTGERMMPEMLHSTIIIEHLHRYALASLFCKNKRVLDIASGEGYGSNILSQYAAHVTGVDIDDNAVKHAAGRYSKENLLFKTGSADKIPLQDASVDVVVSFETIEHHDKHDEMVSEIKRVLKSDGLLIISTPDKKYYSDIPQLQNPFHVKELYAGEFEELLRRYFTNVKIFGQQCGTISALFPLEKGSFTDLWLSKGDTDKIEITDSLEPVFLIALASQTPIEYNPLSFFKDARLSDVIYKGQLDMILRSKTYRLGNALISPLRWVRSIFSSKKTQKAH